MSIYFPTVPRCPLGTYIADLSTGESACVPCPGNSFNSGKNLNIIMKCTCFRGYYRTKLEGPNFVCSGKEYSAHIFQVLIFLYSNEFIGYCSIN